MPLNEAQRALVDSLNWYHALDFGDYQTVGRFKPTDPPNMTLFGVMDILKDVDVAGLKCLDVGPAHGLISFGLALKGADVTTINIGGGKPPQIKVAEEIFGVTLDYRSGVSLADAPTILEPATFDLIVCAGVMYHLLNPADVFFRLRPLLKRNGLLVMETVYAEDRKDPVLVLNSETQQFPQPTTYFLASASAIEGMARLASFDILATRACAPARFALLGKAVLPEEVRARTGLTKQMHDFGFEDPSFQVKALSTAVVSPIAYKGAGGHKRIDVRAYKPTFRPHPIEIRNPIGKPITG
jgi:2-polyprenyl-3-methyl-5-hydroxy-6-metoxy-1,4-benzoquinol methylase